MGNHCHGGCGGGSGEVVRSAQLLGRVGRMLLRGVRVERWRVVLLLMLVLVLLWWLVVWCVVVLHAVW